MPAPPKSAPAMPTAANPTRLLLLLPLLLTLAVFSVVLLHRYRRARRLPHATPSPSPNRIAAPTAPATTPATTTASTTAAATSTVTDTPVTGPPKRKHHCILYDRPPRTGSTTVSRALTKCMQEHYNFVTVPSENRTQRPFLVRRMLALSAPRVLLARHLYMSLEDVALLQNWCDRLLYLSSCRPVRERLWSAAKYKISHGGNGNATVTDNKLRETLNFYMRRSEQGEAFLEAYPYLHANESAIGVRVQDRFVPQYVVRNQFLQHDLALLLAALRCPTDFRSDNVHTSTAGTPLDELRKRPLVMGDATYRRLTALAEKQNKHGLRKVTNFL